MTRAEVESILGGPPRVVGAKPKFVSFAPTEQEGEIGPHGIIVGERAEWYGDRGRIVVGFDTSGRVKAKQYYRPLTP